MSAAFYQKPLLEGAETDAGIHSICNHRNRSANELAKGKGKFWIFQENKSSQLERSPKSHLCRCGVMTRAEETVTPLTSPSWLLLHRLRWALVLLQDPAHVLCERPRPHPPLRSTPSQLPELCPTLHADLNVHRPARASPG